MTEHDPVFSHTDFDLIVTSDSVLTMTDDPRTSLSIGIRGEQIAAIDADLSRYSASRYLDARGLTVIPGLIDAHCHTAWFGFSLDEINCAKLRSLSSLYELLRSAAEQSQPGSWVVASGFNQRDFDMQYPDLSTLDAVCPENPVLIRHASGHSSIINSFALRLADLENADPGVRESIVRRSDGEATGLLEERAQSLVQRLFLPRSQNALCRAIDNATSTYARQGITSFTEAGVGGGWIGHSPIEVAAYQTARDKGKLHARAQLMAASDVLHNVAHHATDSTSVGIDLGITTGFGDDWIRIGPMKIFMDGSLLGLTAAMNEPYLSGDSNNVGYFQSPVEDLRSRIVDAAGAGWTIAAHAIGDRAVEVALGAFATATERYGRPKRMPHRIEHGGVVSDAQVAQAAALGVCIVPQPGFINAFGEQMTKAIGTARSQHSYRVRSILESGMPVAGSSDRPVATGDPFQIMQAFVSRSYGDGLVYGPHERVDPRTALACYTRGSAAVTGSARSKGQITPGYLADLAILDSNPLEVDPNNIARISVLATVVGGQFSYDGIN